MGTSRAAIRAAEDREIVDRYVRVLYRKRCQLGLKQAEGARRAGMTRQMVSAIEGRRRDPSLTTFLRLCRALEIDAGPFVVAKEHGKWVVLVRRNLSEWMRPEGPVN